MAFQKGGRKLTDEELSKAAMTERYPNSNMSYDWLAWYKLRDVYREYKAGRITKEEGEAQKAEIFGYRQKDIDRQDGHKKVEIHFAQFWAKIEEAGRNYMKEPSLEHADRFLEAVYGAGRLQKPREAQKG